MYKRLGKLIGFLAIAVACAMVGPVSAKAGSLGGSYDQGNDEIVLTGVEHEDGYDLNGYINYGSERIMTFCLGPDYTPYVDAANKAYVYSLSNFYLAFEYDGTYTFYCKQMNHGTGESSDVSISFYHARMSDDYRVPMNTNGLAMDALKARNNLVARDINEVATELRNDATAIAEADSNYQEFCYVRPSVVVASNATTLVDSATVSLVGLALNMEVNKTSSDLTPVVFQFSKGKGTVPAAYEGLLLEVGVVDENGGTLLDSLRFPVQVTMSYPTGVKTKGLAVGMVNGGKLSEIPYVDNGNGTLSFVITNVGTLGFLHKQAISTETSQSNGTSAEVSMGDGDMTVGELATQTVLSGARIGRNIRI